MSLKFAPLVPSAKFSARDGNPQTPTPNPQTLRSTLHPTPHTLTAELSAQVGKQGESCASACAAVGKTCRAEWAERINVCHELEKALSCVNGCSDEFYGSDLPAFNTHRNECLINNTPAGAPFSCDATYAQSRRLCPCGA